MSLKTVVGALLALCIGASGAAFAQGNQDRNERGNSGHAKQKQMRRDQCIQPQPRMHEDRREGRGAGPDHKYYRGGRMPPQYRTSVYVVSDWRGHHFSAPPRGYHWVQSGGDYVLVAIATVGIEQAFLGPHESLCGTWQAPGRPGSPPA
ncbi:MAG: RcnB family protein [Vitreoscilla sp.]|nr:RcnB family protein [Vitreoscilla sp.]